MNKGDPVRLFAVPRQDRGPVVRLLSCADRGERAAGTLFKELPADFAFTGFAIVDQPELADFFLVPESIRELGRETKAYLQSVRKLSVSYTKPLLLFLSGDYCHRLHIEADGIIVFTGSTYRHLGRSNEVVYAPFVSNVAGEIETSPRRKQERPVVSFCGYAGFPTWRSAVRYALTNIFLDAASFLSGQPERRTLKRGIHFRRAAMKLLRRDKRLETKFIVRPFFSGNLSSIRGNPERIRSEYLESIRESDFVLCPKGDANFSSRFYETLSMGRIPVLIDTDMILPFEHLIDYDRFIVRVPYDEIDRIGDYIIERYESLSDEKFRRMQEEARTVFREYLRYDAYFNRALPLLRDGGIAAVVGHQ